MKQDKKETYFWYHDANGEGGWYFGDSGDSEEEFGFLDSEYCVGPFDSYGQAVTEYGSYAGH